MATKKIFDSVKLYRYEGGVTAVPGFVANGISCGIKPSGKKDLCMIFSHTPCVGAAVFTSNRVKAAPLKVSKSNVKNKIHAIVCNSGNANACTGKQGAKDARTTLKKVSEEFEIPANSIFVASTGVIGVPMPMDAVEYGVSKLRKKLIAENNEKNAADAMLTTDTRRKMAKVTCVIGGKVITIGGIAKGSGMINPNMATMLAFLTTDLNISQQLMQKALRNACKQSFNKITVDGQMSTNDTVFLLSNGKQNNVIINRPGNNYSIFEHALSVLCKELALQIVNDGEGATKVVTIKVTQAAKKSDADLIAREVGNSALVKTAFYGQSANWGRVIQAIGATPVPIVPDKINIYINDVAVCKEGQSTGLKMVEGRQLLNKRNLELRIELGMGKASEYIITNDLSYDYVKINSHYS